MRRRRRNARDAARLKLLHTNDTDLITLPDLGRRDFEKGPGPDSLEKAIRRMVDREVSRFRGFSCDPALTLDATERLDPDALEELINTGWIPIEPEGVTNPRRPSAAAGRYLP